MVYLKETFLKNKNCQEKVPKLGRRMDEHNENFNNEIDNITQYQTEVTGLKNTVSEMKNIQVQQYSRLSRRMNSELKERAVKLTQKSRTKKIF